MGLFVNLTRIEAVGLFKEVFPFQSEHFLEQD
jgi:hypothetical protein